MPLGTRYIQPMTKTEAIQYYGTHAKLARALGISRQAVTDWGDRIPEGRQWQLEVVTGGDLKADRRDLPEAATA